MMPRLSTPLSDLELPLATKLRLSLAMIEALSDITGRSQAELLALGLIEADIVQLEVALGCEFLYHPIVEGGEE